MRPLISPLLPLLVTSIHAASEHAKVYIFPEQRGSSDVPILTPEEAILIVAQRLRVSQYHDLHYASKDTLLHINSFGGQQSPIFFDDDQNDRRSNLVIIVKDVSSKIGRPLIEPWQSIKPAFEIANPPSKSANRQLISNMMLQGRFEAPFSCSLEDSVNPFREQCWAGRSNFIQFDLSLGDVEEFRNAQSCMLRFVQEGALDAMIIMVPESVQKPENTAKTYGSYDVPSRSRSRRGEEPIELPDTPNSKTPNKVSGKANITTPLKGVIPLCHSSVDSCITITNNCSGHGSCFRKYGSGGEACYTCSCVPTLLYNDTTYWGGAACSKEDVSGKFWVLATFSIVAVSLLSWVIGMMFAIGEEKLPGVIGAGVSGPKAR